MLADYLKATEMYEYYIAKYRRSASFKFYSSLAFDSNFF